MHRGASILLHRRAARNDTPRRRPTTPPKSCLSSASTSSSMLQSSARPSSSASSCCLNVHAQPAEIPMTSTTILSLHPQSSYPARPTARVGGSVLRVNLSVFPETTCVSSTSAGSATPPTHNTKPDQLCILYFVSCAYREGVLEI